LPGLSGQIHRIDQTDGGWKRRPFDLDRLNGVACLLHSVRDHESDGIADVTHHVAREDRIRRPRKRLVRQVEQTGKTAEILDVVGGENRPNAGEPSGTRHIDLEFCMGVRRPQYQGMHRRRRRIIVRITALAANERVVFLAQDALPDTEFYGSHAISGCNLERF